MPSPRRSSSLSFVALYLVAGSSVMTRLRSSTGSNRFADYCRCRLGRRYYARYLEPVKKNVTFRSHLAGSLFSVTKGEQHARGMHRGWEGSLIMIFLRGDQLMRRIMLCMGWCLGFVLTSPFATSGTPATSDANATEFECVIEPHQVVKLASPVVGVIGRLDIDRGDIVRQGQIVGKLEDGVEAAALELARARATNEYTIKSIEARLDYLQKKYARLEELHAKAVSSRAALEEAEAEAKATEQQLKEARLNRELAYLQMRQAEEVLNQRTLRSPING